MATVVVELTGDEAKLVASMRKVIEQQSKMTSEAVKTAQEAKKLEAEQAKVLKIYTDEVSKLELQSVALKKGNAAAAEMRAIQQGLSKEQAARIGTLTQELELQKKIKAESEQQESHSTNITSSILQTAAAYISFSSAVSAVTSSMQEQVRLQKQSLDLQLEAARAQQEAAKNLAGNTAQQIGAILEQKVPEIALQVGFSDLNALTTAVGSVRSIVGDELTPSIVKVAAEFNKLTPEGLQSSATALADLTKATGLTKPEEVMSLVLSTGAVARPEEMNKLAEGAVKAVNSGIKSAPGQNQLEATTQSLAGFATLTSIDKEGRSAATNFATFSAQLGELFKEAGKLSASDESKLTELRKKKVVTEAETVEISRAEFELSQKELALKRAGTGDRAKDAELDVAEARVKLQRAKESAGLDAEESVKLADLEKRKSAIEGMTDPGSIQGRMEAVARNPELRKGFEENLKGEEVFKPLLMGLVTEGSKEWNEFRAALKNVSTDAGNYTQALDSLNATNQQKTANRVADLNTVEAVRRFRDREGSARAEIAQTSADALSGSAVTLGQSFANVAVSPLARSIENSSGTAVSFGTNQIASLQNRRQDLAGREQTPELVDKIAVLDQAILNIQKIVDEQRTYADEIRRNNDLLAENNKQIAIQNGKNPNQANALPQNPAAAIRNQVAQPPVIGAQ